MKMPCKLLAVAGLAASAMSFASPAGAAPIAAPSSLQNAGTSSVESVRWRGRGWGWAPGVVAGAIIGGAIAATQPWNWGYAYDGYAYDPGYGYGYAPGYAYAPRYAYSPDYAYAPGGYAPGYSDYAYAPGGYTTGYSGGGDIAYCSQRFRSYDRASGTYLGYDGQRHSCP
jgi:BA14K-like protein